jgi:peroxiredoxin
MGCAPGVQAPPPAVPVEASSAAAAAPVLAPALPGLVTQVEASPASADGVGPGWLGVALTPREGGQPGVLITKVLRGSPAAVQGLELGDIVQGVDGERTSDPAVLSEWLRKAGAGHRVNLMVVRQGAYRLLAVDLGENPGLEGQLRMGFVGAPAPELLGVSVAQGGVQPSLQSLRGQVVVLEFWATWCGACRALLPTLNAWHEQYAAEGAQVLSVTVDAAEKASQDALQLGLHYPVLSDPEGQTARNYQAFALPTVFLIDRQGVVRDVLVGYDRRRIAELQQTLERLLERS